jgi:hypothetical protein
MTLISTRRALAGLATLLCLTPAAIVVTGCGSDAPDPIAEAAAATRKSDGAKVAMEVAFEGAGAPGGLNMKADGVADIRAGEMQMELDMGDISKALPNNASNVDPAQLNAELRLVDKVLYTRMGLLSQQLPKGKKWLKLDIEKLGQGLGIDVSQLSQYNDPTKMLNYLRESGDVDEVGEEDVRGVQTTHYRAKVDLAKATKKLQGAGAASGTGVDQLVKFLGDSKVPVDVWVGDDKLVRRMTMRLSPSGSGAAAANFSMRMNMDLFDYGTPVSVSAPPESEVYDASELINSAAGAGAGAGGSQSP